MTSTTNCKESNSAKENHHSSEKNGSFQEQMTKKEANGNDKNETKIYCKERPQIPIKIIYKEKMMKVESKKSVKHYWIINRIQNPNWNFLFRSLNIISIFYMTPQHLFKYFKNYIEHETIYVELQKEVFIDFDDNKYICEKTRKIYEVNYEFLKFGNAVGHEFYRVPENKIYIINDFS